VKPLPGAAAVLCAWFLAAQAPAQTAVPAPGTADREAVDREFTLAAPEIDRINHLMQAEIARVMSGALDEPPGDVAKLMSGAGSARPRLDDQSVPLHLRLIERKRLELTAAVNWARSTTGHCDYPQFGPPQLVDPAFRRHMHDVLACRRAEIDRYQAGFARLNKEREASVLALKLPSFAQERMSAQAREATRQQEAAVEAVYANRRATYDAIEDLFAYMDTHPAHFVDGHIQFDKDADRVAAQALIDRFTAAVKLPQ
jgi:hypothetical protein